MRLNTGRITVNAVARSGPPITGVIPPGFAELTDRGIITAFTVLTDENPFGRHLLLDKRRNPHERRVRAILTKLASVGLTVAEGRIVHSRTGQTPNMGARFLLGGINHGLVTWLDRATPSILDEEVGYYDHAGLVIDGALRVS